MQPAWHDEHGRFRGVLGPSSAEHNQPALWALSIMSRNASTIRNHDMCYIEMPSSRMSNCTARSAQASPLCTSRHDGHRTLGSKPMRKGSRYCRLRDDGMCDVSHVMRHCSEHKHGEPSLPALAIARARALARLLALARALARALAMGLPRINSLHLPLPLCSRLAGVAGGTIPRG